MEYVVSYDISDDKKRLKISKILDDYGTRVQGSVFELAGLKQKTWLECLKRIEKIELDENESVRIYAICGSCVSGISVLGDGVDSMVKPKRYII